MRGRERSRRLEWSRGILRCERPRDAEARVGLRLDDDHVVLDGPRGNGRRHLEQRGELCREIAGGREPICRPRRDRATEDGLDPSGERRVLCEQLELRIVGRAREHLAEHDAQAEDVAARIERLSDEELGREIAMHAAGLLRCHERRPRQAAREAEVGELEQVGQHDDVVGLEVAVAEAGGIERRGDLRDDGLHLPQREALRLLAAQFHDPPQRQALEELQRDPGAVEVFARVVDLGDVLVRKLLHLEHLGSVGAALLGHLEKARREDLQRHLDVRVGFDGAVHPAQRPGPDVLLDEEAPGDGIANLERRALDGDAVAAAARAEARDGSRLEPQREGLPAAAALLGAVLDVPTAAIAKHLPTCLQQGFPSDRACSTLPCGKRSFS